MILSKLIDHQSLNSDYTVFFYKLAIANKLYLQHLTSDLFACRAACGSHWLGNSQKQSSRKNWWSNGATFNPTI